MKMMLKTFGVIILVMIIGFIFTACRPEPEIKWKTEYQPEYICSCEDEAHLGIGQANGSCATVCDCVAWTDTLDGIAIKKQAGVTNAQAGAAVARTQYIYENSGLSSGHKDIFKSKVTEIRIVPGNTATLDGSVLFVGINATKTVIEDCIFDDIIFAMFKQFDNSKNTVRMA